MIDAVPRPKWKSSVPLNSPLAMVTGANGVGAGVGDATGSLVGGAVGADGATDGAGADAIGGAADGATSTSEVLIQIGEARYQVKGRPIASAIATRTVVLPGWRRAATIQPRRQAITAASTTARADPIATGSR